ncbi:VPDSG-CTERM sorting domain-containing protein [Pelagicoccus sp. NFK12]|uniref:VPDSG-CTERM sorting domain-containing protein n=1 Tax=Pelagicoccus enzymogenes TaxID=2773457 RepID=A0A927FAZ8_9BACT|nr:VPDSG-CTERM sorting domain-containing protein [Pelagicoccus enzymogenes]MBD5781099.1 VPDSG-CTERM sorting domain-containing protein [Pelagicoccus enzymogenes]MDQ8199806.1 VPDSG-CTERM sorting domain-containing protein [Pelagicoccus enzymogenes]
MKSKLFISLFAVAASLSSFAGSASAITLKEAQYRHIIFQNETLSLNDLEARGVFNLVTGGNGIKGDNDAYNRDGYNVGTDVSEAIVGFIFRDFVGDAQVAVNRAEFNIGSYLNNLVVGGPVFSTTGDAVEPDLGLFEISFQTSDFATLKAQLEVDIETDGMVSWVVRLDETYLDQNTSVKLATAYLGANVVPDAGATAGMLGLSIAGLLVFARRSRLR